MTTSFMAILACLAIGGHVTDAAPRARAAKDGLQHAEALQDRPLTDQASADQRHRTHADEGFAGSNGFNDETFANRAGLPDQAAFDKPNNFAAAENANRNHHFEHDEFGQDQASADLRSQSNGAFAETDQGSHTDQAAADRAFADKSSKTLAQDKAKRDHNAAQNEFAEDNNFNDQPAADLRQQGGNGEAFEFGGPVDQAPADLREKPPSNAFAGRKQDAIDEVEMGGNLPDEASFDEFAQPGQAERFKRSEENAQTGFAEGDDEATSKSPDLPKLLNVDKLNELDTREEFPTVS